MMLEDFVIRAKHLGVHGVSLESCSLREYSGSYQSGVKNFWTDTDSTACTLGGTPMDWKGINVPLRT